MRLERIDRRVTLQKQRDVPETSPGINCNSNTSINPVTSPIAGLTCATPVTSTPVTVASVEKSPVINMTPNVRKRKRDDAGSVCSAASKRTNRSASWNSMRELKEELTPIATSGKVNGRSSKKESIHRRRRKKIVKNGRSYFYV